MAPKIEHLKYEPAKLRTGKALPRRLRPRVYYLKASYCLPPMKCAALFWKSLNAILNQSALRVTIPIFPVESYTHLAGKLPQFTVRAFALRQVYHTPSTKPNVNARYPPHTPPNPPTHRFSRPHPGCSGLGAGQRCNGRWGVCVK